MAGDITGVKGFFEDYDKGAGPPKTQPVKIEASVKGDRHKSANTVQVSKQVRARVGRPPGVISGSRSDKTKATMHVNEALLNFYRDWSWEARCNLGELIERAMVAYKKARTDSTATGHTPSSLEDSRAG